MNRFNNKKYYKPPPVKPSNRLREKPKEDWNPYQSDLNKYKLSNAEILKKKINATSKNLEEAKRDWQGQIAMIQNGKMKINFDDDMEGRQKIVRKKIDLTPMNRFEKRSVNIDAIRNNDRNIYQNNRINRPYSGYEDNYRNKTKKNNSFNQKIGNNFQSNPAQDNNLYDDEDDDGEIKMVYNTGNNANVIETKIKKENNFSNYNNDISNNAAFNEFEKTIQKMQEHLQQKNENKENNLEIKQNEVIFNNENNLIQKQNNYINNNTNSNRKNENNLNNKKNKKINKKNIPNNPNKKEFLNNNTNPNKNKNKKRKVKNEENKLIDDLKKDINDKFNNLEGINELDNCMKQLDFMIAKSKQKSIQNRLNDDSKNPQFYRSENENFYQNNNQKEENNQIDNQYLQNINNEFQPSYKKNIQQKSNFKDTKNEMENYSNITLHTKAPRFNCDSNIGPLKLTDYLGKWVILFSYNSNFTPVSTTEVVSFSKYIDEFHSRNCELLGVSLDNVPSHMAWIKDIENSTGVSISFPLLADTDKEICTMYDMIDVNTNEPCRTVYFISPASGWPVAAKCARIWCGSPVIRWTERSEKHPASF